MMLMINLMSSKIQIYRRLHHSQGHHLNRCHLFLLFDASRLFTHPCHLLKCFFTSLVAIVLSVSLLFTSRVTFIATLRPLLTYTLSLENHHVPSIETRVYPWILKYLCAVIFISPFFSCFRSYIHWDTLGHWPGEDLSFFFHMFLPLSFHLESFRIM